MKIITQLSLFEELELGDLEKILAVVDSLPETGLLKQIESKRKCGRQDYSVQPYFIAYIAKLVLQFQTDKQLIRQLNCNSQLRQICGFETHYVTLKNGSLKKVHAPSAASFSRFMTDLEEVVDNLESWTKAAFTMVYDHLPDFGVHLALDGKYLDSYASPYQKDKKRQDHRADLEADFSKKETHLPNGQVLTIKHYGYRLHVFTDTKYELPVAWKVTPDSNGEPTIVKKILKNMSQTILDRARYLMADKGYSGKPLQDLLEDADIIPIIASRHQWKEDETRQYLDNDLIYNQSGQVWYVDENGKAIELIYKGYDKSSSSLRYSFHPKYNNTKIYRLKHSVEPIIFNIVARSSEKFKRLYKEHTSIERLNGRLNRDFRLENHTIRGLAKMRVGVALSFLVMVGFALHKINHGERAHLAGWVA